MSDAKKRITELPEIQSLTDNEYTVVDNSSVGTKKYKLKRLKDEIDNKVDKISGKSLSTNDYTTEEKNKLAGIETQANKTIVDSALNDSSTNPVQNKKIYERFASLETDLGLLKDFEGYTDDILGLQIDFTNKTYTRLGAAVGSLKGTDFDQYLMFGGRRRCNVADDGTINAYYGDSGYTEDGSNGQVMVYQPKFYYKVVPLKLEKQSDGLGFHIRKANYYISATPKEGFKVFPAFIDSNGKEVEYILLGAYEASLYDTSASAYITDDAQVMDATASTGDKLSSIANVKPASGLTQNLTRPNIEQLAQNRGTNWHGLFVQAAAVDIWLMMIEFGTLNSQTGSESNGIVSLTDQSAYNCSGNTGSTASLGNASGQATSTTFVIGETTTTETTNGKTSYSYRGVENPWGNIWKFVYGINIWGDGTLKGGVPYVCTDFSFAESKKTDNYKSAGFTVTNVSNYITALGYSEEFDWLMMASETGSSGNSIINDYTYVTANLNGYRIARLGGNWNNDSTAGSLYWYLNGGVGARYRSVGARLVHIPKAKD